MPGSELEAKGSKINKFPGGPVTKTVLPVQETWVWALVRELDRICYN